MLTSVLRINDVFPPILAALICFILFTPCLSMHVDFNTALKIHIYSFLFLAVLFEIPAVFLNCWSLFVLSRREDDAKKISRIKKVFGYQYMLSHFVFGPFFGIMTVASGIYLIHVGGHTFNQGWLFWLMNVAIFGWYEGMYHHNIFVKKVRRYVHDRPLNEQRVQELKKMVSCPFDQMLIFSEPISFSFVFLTAYFKPDSFINPIAFITANLEQMVGSSALFGLILMLCGSVLIPIFRTLMRKYSYISIK